MDIALAMKERHSLISKPQPQQMLHVSLMRFDLRGRLFEETVSRVSWVLNTIEFKPFEVVFDRVMSFRRDDRKPLVLCCAKGASEHLVDLQHRIAGELGLKIRGKLNPYMTLLWDDQLIGEQMLDMPVRWAANEACLIHSLVGRAAHRILWPEHPATQ
jgi:2'-5' RNA ligase